MIFNSKRMAEEFEPGRMIAIAFIAGFAIQQFLQILDPVITSLVIRDRETIWRLPATDFKKSLLHLAAFLCGLVIAGVLDIDLLKYVTEKHVSLLNFLISGFVLGSGTEAANTLIKYFGYVKDAKKYSVKPEIEITVIPSQAVVKVNETIDLRCVVKNVDNTGVTWSVLQGNGGAIQDGKYTAPPTPGDYAVIATSNADQSVFAVARVTVKA